MNSQKILWEKLAKENPKYYNDTDYGRKITDEQFRENGKMAYKKYVAEDKILQGKESILDYGCGLGRLTEFMANDYKKVYGVDISGTMLGIAHIRLKGLTNIELLETDGESIPLTNNITELVFSSFVFQHIKKRKMVKNTFREIYRVLKPEGIFKVLLRSDKNDNLTQWWSGVDFDEQSIRKVYEKIGFKKLKIEYESKYAYWLWVQK